MLGVYFTEIEPKIYVNRGEYANPYNADAVNPLKGWLFD